MFSWHEVRAGAVTAPLLKRVANEQERSAYWNAVCQNDRATVVELLRETDININERFGVARRTAVFQALHRGHDELVCILALELLQDK